MPGPVFLLIRMQLLLPGGAVVTIAAPARPQVMHCVPRLPRFLMRGPRPARRLPIAGRQQRTGSQYGGDGEDQLARVTTSGAEG
jgi:hypothetical protein